jgi:glycerol kinase
MNAGNGRLSIALDLGSTRIKLGALDDKAQLLLLDERASPPLTGSGLVRESDPMLWLDAVGELLAGAGGELPLGLSSQRSSFLLWRRDDGQPETALISWQDRRARDWCARHARLQTLLVQRAGLRLSAHYAGPKLASLLERRPDWQAGLASGELLFGTLDSWLVWVLSGQRAHVTDLSMAARTGMLALDTGDWCGQLLEAFGVPRTGLPDIVASTGQSLPLAGGAILNASVADQSAGALALLADDDSALVNFGTGAFVLRADVERDARVPGYLTAALLGNARARYALEGTINGAGPSLDECAPPPTELPEADPCADGFALPDRAGIGSPHWRPGLGPLLSAPVRALDGPGQRRVLLEGLLFRVREILDDLGTTGRAGRILLSGGLVRDPALAPGLATLLERRVELLTDGEAGLIGAARLAAGLPPHAQFSTQPVDPGAAGAYLVDKYPRWRSWLDDALQASSASDSPQ